LALAAISLWGFAQLATGATARIAATNLRDARLRRRFLNAFAWFGCALSLVSVMAYFTSRGRILWIFASPYPDVWGAVSEPQ